MNSISKPCLVIGGLPLFIYPFVVLADLMSFAGERTGHPPFYLILMVQCFLWGTLAYPLVYGASWIFHLVALKRSRDGAALVFSIVPLLYLAIIIVLFIVSARLGAPSH